MDKRRSDQFLTIADRSEVLYKEKGSKFISYVVPCADESSVILFLDEVKSIHPKANHHCYAWRLGMDKDSYRLNDDGEPSGTAGRPILGQIDKFELTNILIVVVRYFGGTKLGTSGLIQAYKTSAALGIKSCEIITKTVFQKLIITCDYQVYNQVEKVIANSEIDVLNRDLSDNCKIMLSFPKSMTTDIIDQLKVGITQDYLENVKDLDEFEHFRLELID